jgi:hypothetical protein
MEWRVEGRLDAAGRRRDQAAADRAQCDSKRSTEERRKGECEVRRVVAALGVPFIGKGRRQRWANWAGLLGPKQKRAGRLDGPPCARWAEMG